jgi:hypothetical protein
VNAQPAHTRHSSTIAQGASVALRSPWLLAGSLALMLGTSGCVAHAATAAAVTVDEPVVEVETVPVAVESYPRQYYQGEYVYLVDGSWYYRRRGHWVVYTVEPRALVDVRLGYEARFGAHYRPHAEVASPAPRPHAPASHGHKNGHKKH